jgi:hypothetical protein
MSRPDELAKTLEVLRRQHLKLDKQVVQLEERRWLSPAEEAEVRRLKRMKLAAKDKMRQLRPEA